MTARTIITKKNQDQPPPRNRPLNLKIQQCSGTFSTILRRVLMLRIHQPTPTALSSDHWGSPLCMAGIMFSSSSSASEWKAQAK